MATPVSFNAFVVSLATMAAVHFGEVSDPQTGEMRPPDLDAAGRAIEMLALLEQKTRGNLTDDEERFMARVLQELRSRYRIARNGSDS